MNHLGTLGTTSRAKLQETTTIRRTVVREPGVSHHHGGSIESSLETPQTSQYNGIAGIKANLQLVLHYARDASLR